MRLRLAIVGLVLLTSSAGAQVIGVRPANPTSADQILLEVSAPGSDLEPLPIVISGSEIRITFRGTGNPPGGSHHEIEIGRLAPGTYSIIVAYEFAHEGLPPHTRVEEPPFMLVVAALPIPALNPFGLGALAALVALAGFVVARRV